ncbi:uncharacterized protein AKAME5_000576000 [Lates japonicus]|uniref:Endonuclease/exonuclease/phosphatase domain-containing protein n=1 Tax=Lates japonicus TaxID=270547 RepID=A0AAD3MDZ9_LATJO|nr:uncharacterized protein AKAME5_000576000 [Lates japonicus]
MALRHTSSQLLRLNHSSHPSMDLTTTLRQFDLLRRCPYTHRGSRRKVFYNSTPKNSIPSLWSDRSSHSSALRHHNIRTCHLSTRHLSPLNILPVLTSASRTSKQKPLRTALFNTRSLNNKSLILNKFILDNKLDLLCLTETWHKPMDYIALNQTTPTGYSYMDNPRSEGCGGGIAVIYLAIISHSPKTSSSFLSNFTNVFTQLSFISPSILLLGNFNIHINSPKSKFTADFLDKLLQPHPTCEFPHLQLWTYPGPGLLNCLPHHSEPLTNQPSDHLAVMMDIIIPTPNMHAQ